MKIQKSNIKLGAILITFVTSLSWLSMANFAMMVLLSWGIYQEKIVNFIPWVNIYWVIAVIIIGIITLNVVEYALFQPSRVAFSNQQAFKHKSPVQKELEIIKHNQKLIMDKLGIKDDKK
jgi:hypothetical protein